MADDANPNASGQVDGADGQTDGNDDKGGDDDDTGDNGGIVFDTQDDLDAFIEKRLRRDRRARAGKNADKSIDKGAKDDDKADRDDAKVAQREAAAEARIEKAQRIAVNAEALLAGADLGLDGERAKAAAKLADLNLTDVLDDDGEVDDKAVRAAVKAALKTYPFLKAATNAPAAEGGDDDTASKTPVGGQTPKPDGDKAPGAVTPERFAEMSYKERVQLFNRDPQLYNQLSGVA